MYIDGPAIVMRSYESKFNRLQTQPEHRDTRGTPRRLRLSEEYLQLLLQLFEEAIVDRPVDDVLKCIQNRDDDALDKVYDCSSSDQQGRMVIHRRLTWLQLQASDVHVQHRGEHVKRVLDRVDDVFQTSLKCVAGVVVRQSFLRSSVGQDTLIRRQTSQKTEDSAVEA